MLIGFGGGMTSIDFGFTMSKVEVKKSPLCKQWFHVIFLRTFCLRAIIFYMLNGFGGDMPPIDIKLIKSKVKVRRITFVKRWFPLYLDILLSQRFQMSSAY